MTDQESEYFYSELAQMMSSYGMERVVKELEEEFHSAEDFSYADVNVGIFNKTAHPYQQTLPGVESSSKDPFSSENLYPPKKRLSMLIGAIEQSVINVAEIEDYVSNFFMNRTKVDEIKFYSNRNDEKSFILNRQEALSRLAGARALRVLLSKLRVEIE